MTASGGNTSAAGLAHVGGGNTIADMGIRKCAAQTCYPVTIFSGTGDAGRCGRNGRMKLGKTLDYHYTVAGTNFLPFYLSEHVGIDHNEGDYHRSMADPIAALAVALRSARVLAESLEYKVGFGWPTVWDSNCCLVYDLNSEDEKQFDQNSGADDILNIKKATEKFFHLGGEYLHLGEPPAIFSDANHVTDVFPVCPAQVLEDSRDDVSDAGSEAPGRDLTQAQSRREEALRLTASRALKMLNNCRLKTEAAAQKVLAAFPNEKIKEKETSCLLYTSLTPQH